MRYLGDQGRTKGGGQGSQAQGEHRPPLGYWLRKKIVFKFIFLYLNNQVSTAGDSLEYVIDCTLK